MTSKSELRRLKVQAVDGELPDRVRTCDKCQLHYIEQGQMLINSCASVGVEVGKSTWQMVAEYLEGFHRRGHRT